MIITKQDLEGWCNCENFPFSKCDECKLKLGDITYLKENECIINGEKMNKITLEKQLQLEVKNSNLSPLLIYYLIKIMKIDMELQSGLPKAF